MPKHVPTKHICAFTHSLRFTWRGKVKDSNRAFNFSISMFLFPSFQSSYNIKNLKNPHPFFCPSFNRSTTMKTAFTGGGCQVEACPTVKIRVNKMLTVDVLVTPAVIQDKIEMGTHTHQNEASLVPTFRSHDETFHSKLATGCSTFDHVWRYFTNFKFPFVPSTCTVFLQQRCWI